MLIENQERLICDFCGRSADRPEIQLRYEGNRGIVIRNPRLCNACIGAMYMDIDCERELHYYAEAHEFDYDTHPPTGLPGSGTPQTLDMLFVDESEKIEAVIDSDKVLKQLSPMNKFIVCSFFGINDSKLTENEIGEILGMSQQAIHKRIIKSLDILRDKTW